MRMTLAAVCMMAFAALAPAQTQPDLPTIRHDARALTRDVEVNWPPPELPLRAAFASVAASRSLGLPKVRALDENLLLELLRDAARDDQSGIVFDDGMVMVKGPVAVQDVVEARIQSLTAVLLQEVRLEAYSLTPGPATPSGVLAAADVDRVLAEKGAVVLGSTTVVLGQPGYLRTGRATNFVSDYDVEVAEDAAIAKPVVRVLQEGIELHAWVGQAVDQRLILRLTLTRAGLAENLAARAVGSTRVGQVQLPKVLSTVLAASGFLEDGGALLIRHDGGFGAATLVRVRRVSAPPAPDAQGRHVVFADDLLGRPIVVDAPRVHDDQRSNDEKTMRENVDPRSGPVLWTTPPDGMQHPGSERSADGVLGTLEDDLRAGVTVAGTRLLVQGDAAKATRVRETLSNLAKASSANWTVEFRMGKVELPTQAPWNAEDLASKVGIAAAVPTTGSDQFLVGAGLEQAEVIDHDADIAQKVVIADPRVVPLFSGYLIGGAVASTGPARVELVCDLQHQEILPGPPDGFALGADNVGPLDLPQIVALGGRFRTFLEPGRWAVVTTANGSGSPTTLVVLARVRKS